ncbi:INSulin related [Caenorhabditis elegans]|uniref:INSulin related n=1 Tax=Caenorhabditis elegans TaxID=6239 RepID=Q18160_CAEEL|nr:INSulin related [Caenorhabditis elegans]CCD65657.1 INSulin related [Caenorhabditis elegans]|eukprot:NP_505348.1 Uncharacterized protein CELE_C25E10.11 [Caenorhabditis elegans]
MASFRAIYISVTLMSIVIIYLNSFANEDKPRLARENRPYTILSTHLNLKDYDRLCLNGPTVKCYGETVCKVAKVECLPNKTCDPLMAICSDKSFEDYQDRKFNYTSSR